jgi:AcrR family transcriptional regulator
LAQSSGGKTPAASRPNLLAGEDLPTLPIQTRSVDKRLRLKAAALALFAEKGYNLTSIDDIAHHANFAVGGFYQHFRSKRQLLLVLMDDLLERLSRLDLRPKGAADIRAGLRNLLTRAFSTDLHYLGAYRAWQEAAASDTGLAEKQEQIQAWTTARVQAAFSLLQNMIGARPDVDIPGLARIMDSFFWDLLAQASRFPQSELKRWIDSATHLIYHALFTDLPSGPVER